MMVICFMFMLKDSDTGLGGDRYICSGVEHGVDKDDDGGDRVIITGVDSTGRLGRKILAALSHPFGKDRFTGITAPNSADANKELMAGFLG